MLMRALDDFGLYTAEDLVKEMEMLNHMFNAMERQYVSQASNSSASESYKNVSSFLLKSLKDLNFIS